MSLDNENIRLFFLEHRSQFIELKIFIMNLLKLSIFKEVCTYMSLKEHGTPLQV